MTPGGGQKLITKGSETDPHYKKEEKIRARDFCGRAEAERVRLELERDKVRRSGTLADRQRLAAELGLPLRIAGEGRA